MYLLNYFRVVILFLFNFSFCFSQIENINSKLKIKLTPVFNSQKLVLNENEFVTNQNDTIKITSFKIYLSNIRLLSKLSDVLFIQENNFLVDADDSSTFILTVNNIPSANYCQLQMLIGVDSLANVSGALDGDLDPIKGMFWAWNTGYISAKMEGIFKYNGAFAKKFEFHIGGYRQPYASSRKVLLNIPEIKVTANEILQIECYVDIAKWFNGTTPINLVELNTVVHPCNESVNIANNYSKMIKFKSSKIIK